MSAVLHEQFETMFLIGICPWNDEKKKTICEGLESLGVDGREFYNRFYRLVEQYYRTFEKYQAETPGADLLREMEMATLAVCAEAFLKNPDWFKSPEKITDKAARAAVFNPLASEEYVKDGNIIAALEAMELTDHEKWQILMLEQHSGERLRLIQAAVEANIPAFKKAYARVENELRIIIKNFIENLANPKKNDLLRLPKQVNPDSAIIPTLALPLSIVIVDGGCFYGLMNSRLYTGNTVLSRDELLMGAKVLSEKSKLEILICLKTANRYNLEIAEMIGLTPATVSHHMNALLASGFVEFERRDGKVYYQLAEEGVKSYLEGIKQLLLNTSL